MQNKTDNFKEKKPLEEKKFILDKSLIDQLRVETKLTHEEIKKYLYDRGTINRSQSNIQEKPYKDLQKYADLFGLPIWVLLTNHGEDILMQEVMNGIQKLRSYRISDIGDLLLTLTLESNRVPLKSQEKIDIPKSIRTIENILHRYENWSHSWQVIFESETTPIIDKKNFDKKSSFNWTGNLLFLFNGYEVFRGTLRIWKKSIEEQMNLNNSQRKKLVDMKSAWFFLQRTSTDMEKPRLITKVIEDISMGIFKVGQPNISINLNNDDYILYSWNKLYGEKLEINDLIQSFVSRIYSLNSRSENAISSIHDYFYYRNPETSLEELQGNTFEEEISEQRKENNKDILETLYKHHYLKSGDKIALLFNRVLQATHSTVDPKIWFCHILDVNGNINLLWEKDLKIYTIDTITEQVYKELGYSSLPKRKIWADLWTKMGEDETLNQIYQKMKTTNASNSVKQLTLF